jgi:hypothetical protein
MSPKAWLVAAVAGLAATVGLIWYEEKKSSTPAGPSKPVWAALAPASDGSYTIPAGTGFAVSSLSSNPNLAALTTAMQSLASSGAAMQTGGYPYPAGSPAPAQWPAGDQGGNAATRWGGSMGQTAGVIPAAAASGVSVWTITGYQ